MKNILRKACKYFESQDYRFLIHAQLGLHNNMPDDVFLKKKFKAKMGKELDLVHPKTFNEKLQWLKLYDRRPEYIAMVDKYEVKNYVSKCIGEEYIIPTLGVWDTFDEINFDELPNQFVLKCTHDSGGLVIVKDKSQMNKKAAKRKIERCIKKNYFYVGREWPYKDVKPRIIAEKYMEDRGEELVDYKVHNFNGVPRVILACRDRFKESGLTEDFYLDNWEHIDVKRPGIPNAEEALDQPEELKEMLGLAEKLSKDMSFVRTDFYTINKKIYFGEITFYPASGFSSFEPKQYDEVFGDWMQLPMMNSGGGEYF